MDVASIVIVVLSMFAFCGMLDCCLWVLCVILNVSRLVAGRFNEKSREALRKSIQPTSIFLAKPKKEKETTHKGVNLCMMCACYFSVIAIVLCDLLHNGNIVTDWKHICMIFFLVASAYNCFGSLVNIEKILLWM